MSAVDVKISDGILLTMSKSGTAKIQKVLVQAKPGKSGNYVKCKLFTMRETKRSSKIPIFIKRHARKNSSTDTVPGSCGDMSDVHKTRGNSRTESKKRNLESYHIEGQDTYLPFKKRNRFRNILSAVMQANDITRKEPSVRFIKLPKNCQLTDETSSVYVLSSATPKFEDLETLKLNEYARRHRQNFMRLQPPVIVMTQYEDTLTKQEDDDESSDSYDSVNYYIDSGLRRLKSDESKLHLRTEYYRRTRKHVPKLELGPDDVQPLLMEIPSDIYQKKKKKKEGEKEEEPVPVPEEPEVEESSEEDVKSTESVDIDTTPLDKLKEYEDVTYTIDTGDLPEEIEELPPPPPPVIPAPALVVVPPPPVPSPAPSKTVVVPVPAPVVIVPSPAPKVVPLPPPRVRVVPPPPMDDFCVHTKDAPGSDVFSSSTTSAESFIPEFCVHTKEVPRGTGDFCLCTKEPPQNDSLYSLSSVGDASKELDTKEEPKRSEEATKKKKRKSIFEFFKREDFCVHTTDTAESPEEVESKTEQSKERIE